MLAQEIIHKKREGNALTQEEIDFFIRGMMADMISDSQVSALAMAVFFKGMQRDECVALTQSLQNSGDTLAWSDRQLKGPVVDKHSTGGVGDKVSIMLAPLLASCGAYVPMISGRGLGHTGGTLDKMESIPGYNTTPSIDQFKNIVSQVGCAVIGQTGQMAPADKRLYGIRDVTATVESIPLITASILSKKLSAGLDGLVMDVKTGSGAFAADYAMAQDLAHSIVDVGQGLGLPISALITNMSQVLGLTAGNAIEMLEVVEYLKGERQDTRLHQVVIELGAELLVLSGLYDNIETARHKLNRSLQSGSAAEYFERMVVALGGPNDLLAQSKKHLTIAPFKLPVFTGTDSQQFIQQMDVRAIGNAVVELGGGRRKSSDPVDHAVGLSEIKGIGDCVDHATPIMMVHARSEQAAEQAAKRIRQAVTLTADGGKQTDNNVILERVTAS